MPPGGVLKFGIRSKLLASLVVLLIIPLGALGGLALGGLDRLGASTVEDVRGMGDFAVNSSEMALGELAKTKMVAVADGAAARTEALAQNALAYAGALAAAAKDPLGRGDQPALAALLEATYSHAPSYQFYEYDGVRTGEAFPLYDALFVLASNGTMLAVKGYGQGGQAVGQRYNSEHYFTLASASFRTTAARYYIYDPYMHNTSGRAYWEPASNAEDMILLPRSDLRPFYTAIPSNLDALAARTLDQQRSKSERIIPSDGNWNAHQMGIMVLAPLRIDGALAGMAGLTMSLPAITQFSREVKAAEAAEGKSGYAYTFNRGGVLVSHPTRDHIGSDSTYHWWIAEMHKSDGGILDYTWRGVPKYTSFARVPALDWKVAVTSPKTDFLQPAVDTGKNITAAINRTQAGIRVSETAMAQTTLVLSAVCLGVSVAVGVALANRIVRPIGNLTRLAERISRGSLDAEVAVEGNDELGALAESFINLLTTLRLGNAAYYKGDLRKALDSYRRGLALFETSGNEKGMAMCQNNMGNIFRQWKQYPEADEYYRKALETAQRLGDRRAIAARYTNIGLLMKARGEGSQASGYFDAALKLYTEAGDASGIASVYNNQAILRRERGDTEGALALFQNALDMDRKAQNERGMATRYNNIALIYKSQGDLQKALQCLEYALALDQKLEDAASAYTSLRNLSVLYDDIGQADKARELAAQAAALKSSMKRAKSVMFVMDRSGSMDGEKIIAAKAGALNVLRNKVYGEDRVGIIQFDNESDLLLPLTKKSQNLALIEQAVESIQLRSKTAFYDAVGDAVLHLKENGQSDILWVVALTDGEDNSSRRFTYARTGFFDKRTVLRTYPDALNIDVNMIIIGVGGEVDGARLAEVCRGHGSYIHVLETEGPGEGIIEAYRKVEEIFEESEVVEEYEPEK
jgi:tetratricopeptide (TPR) repeat protein